MGAALPLTATVAERFDTMIAAAVWMTHSRDYLKLDWWSCVSMADRIPVTGERRVVAVMYSFA